MLCRSTHTRMHEHVRKHMHARLYACKHIHRPSCAHALMHACMHLHQNRHCCAVPCSWPNDHYRPLSFLCRGECKVLLIQCEPHQWQGVAGRIMPYTVTQMQTLTCDLLCCCRLARSRLVGTHPVATTFRRKLMELLWILAG